MLVITKVVKYPAYDVERGTGVCPNNKGVAQPSSVTVTIMGVGFGQNAPGGGIPYATPEHNPFLNIIRLSKYPKLAIRNGYTVSTQGIFLGLTDKNTDGAKWAQLDVIPSNTKKDWVPPLTSINFRPVGKLV